MRDFVCHLCLVLPVGLAASGAAVSKEAEMGVVEAGESVDVEAEAAEWPPFMVVTVGSVLPHGMRGSDMFSDSLCTGPRPSR